MAVKDFTFPDSTFYSSFISLSFLFAKGLGSSFLAPKTEGVYNLPTGLTGPLESTGFFEPPNMAARAATSFLSSILKIY